MKRKIIGIFVCMLLIATAFPAVGTMKEIENELNQPEQNDQASIFQRKDYNNILFNPFDLDADNDYHQPFSSHPPVHSRFNKQRINADENSTVCGYIKDRDTDLPIENAGVDLSWQDDQGNYDWNYTYTNSSGYYRMNVAAGEIILYVYASGYLNENTDWMDIGDYETLWVNFSMYPRPPENSIVCGYVNDSETGLPIEYANVNLHWRDDLGHNYYNYTPTNSSGYYSINVAAGEIRLDVYVSGYFSGSTGWLDIGEYETLWVNFSMYPRPPENSVVCGYVNDSETGLPIEYAYIDLDWRDDLGHSESNSTFAISSGFYSMNVAAGEIVINANYDGYAFETVGWIDIGENQTLWLNFTLDPDVTPPEISDIIVPDYVGLNHPGNISANVSDDHLLSVGMVLADLDNITFNLTIWYYIDYTGLSGTYVVPEYDGTYAAVEQGVKSAPTTAVKLNNWTETDKIYTVALFMKNQSSSEQTIFLEFDHSGGPLKNIALIVSTPGGTLQIEYITDMIEPGISIIYPVAIAADGINLIFDPDVNYTLYSIGDPDNPHLSWYPLSFGTYEGMILANDRAWLSSNATFNLTVFYAEPCLEITAIDGGFGVTATINNTGDGDASKEPVTIIVTGGILGFINKTITKEVDIKVGESTKVKTGIIFGLGGIDITVTTPHDEEAATGTQIIIFTLVKK
ncbi:MAG: carboxypeptidase regulatory-like domain-containing protein [Thermoplasmatales archaeon]|nr:MAG: carboxypeptidase regulatory-like domain-containing protein [Thermoplasmatales archaeon]